MVEMEEGAYSSLKLFLVFLFFFMLLPASSITIPNYDLNFELIPSDRFLFSYYLFKTRLPSHLFCPGNLKLHCTNPIDVNNLNGRYYLGLAGITVGENSLNINIESKETSSTAAGLLVLDTGAPTCLVARGVFESLRAHVQKLLDTLQTRVIHPDYPDLLCYTNIVNRDLEQIPLIFHLQSGADLVLDITTMLRSQDAYPYCLNVIQYDSNGLTEAILIHSLSHYHILYDLTRMQLFLNKC